LCAEENPKKGEPQNMATAKKGAAKKAAKKAPAKKAAKKAAKKK